MRLVTNEQKTGHHSELTILTDELPTQATEQLAGLIFRRLIEKPTIRN